MLLTVTPSAATSEATVFAQPVNPARTVFERIKPSMGCFTEIDVMLTTRPQPCFCIPGKTSFAQRIAERQLSSNAFRSRSRPIGRASLPVVRRHLSPTRRYDQHVRTQG